MPEVPAIVGSWLGERGLHNPTKQFRLQRKANSLLPFPKVPVNLTWGKYYFPMPDLVISFTLSKWARHSSQTSKKKWFSEPCQSTGPSYPVSNLQLWPIFDASKKDMGCETEYIWPIVHWGGGEFLPDACVWLAEAWYLIITIVLMQSCKCFERVEGNAGNLVLLWPIKKGVKYGNSQIPKQ